MSSSKSDGGWTDEAIAASDHLNDLVLAYNDEIKKALHDVAGQGVKEDVAVVLVEENGGVTVFALPRENAREMIGQFPGNTTAVVAQMAAPADAGKLWAAVFSVTGTRVASMAMQLVRVRAPMA